jgi:allantoinase
VLLVQHNLTVEDYEAQVMRAFQRLSVEASASGGGRILSLSVSPWIMGYPHRISTLQRLLGRILESGSVWHANGMQIADAFMMQLK